MLTPLRNQHGQALAMMGIGLVVFLGMAALAVDVAHLAFTATEVQALADATAAAAAAGLSQEIGGGDAVHDGDLVAQQNTVAGNHVSTLGACPDATGPSCIDIGLWDPTNGFRHADAPPYNAAQATITMSVPNIVAAMWSPTSTVTKVATAAIRPTLPFAVGIGDQCNPPVPANFDPVNCASNPTARIHLGDAIHSIAGWANFSGELTNPSDIFPFIPVLCPVDTDGSPGGGQAMPILQAGALFFMNTTYSGGPLEYALSFCVENDIMTRFVIPFFRCDSGQPNPYFANAVSFGVLHVLRFNNNPFDPGSDPNIDVQLECAAPNPVAVVQ